MIFQLLRQIFQDAEFEQTKIQLAEAKSLLAEYKDVIYKKSQKVEEDNDKPDIEFITLLWASVGFVSAILTNVIDKIPNDIRLIATPQQVIWFVIVLALIMFVIVNTLFAVDLTKKYASHKKDKRYAMYYQTLSTAIIVYIIGAAFLVLLEGLP